MSGGDVQLKNGFTRVANELLEAIFKSSFNATQLKIILCVIRYTNGFQRNSHNFSISYLSKATGISRRYISNELQKLINDGVILVIEDYTVTKSRKLGINKNYSEWKGYGTVIQQVNNSSTDEEVSTTTGEQSFTTTDEQLFYQERKSKKNNKEMYIPYIEIVNHLNKEANRLYKPNTEKTKKLVKARWNEGFRLEDFKTVIDVKCKDWAGTDMEKYLRPETLFGNKFESYLNQKPIQAQPKENPAEKYFRMLEGV